MLCTAERHNTAARGLENSMTTPDLPLLQRGALASLAEQLAGHYAQRIRSRSLAAGTRLPSVRAAAAQHGLARAPRP